MAASESAVLDPRDLDRMLRDGDVDTVLCAVPDLWGRLVGKRVAPRTFRRILHDGGGLNASLYLFVVDMDMEPLPGFALSDWDRGFQDFLMQPDLSTLRRVPWLERTALVRQPPIASWPGHICVRGVRAGGTSGIGPGGGASIRASARRGWAALASAGQRQAVVASRGR